LNFKCALEGKKTVQSCLLMLMFGSGVQGLFAKEMDAKFPKSAVKDEQPLGNQPINGRQATDQRPWVW
jgi:hypothetical protein